MAVMGCGAVVLMMAVAGLNYHANLESPPRLAGGPFLACVAGFLLYVGGAIVALYRRFPRPQRT
jgi:hypothetical protein